MEEKEKKQISREIDIIAAITKVLKEWKLLFKVCAIAGIIGVVVALNTQRSYTTTVLMAPEASNASSSLGGLSSMGAMLGLNLSSMMTSDAIYPEIYPDILATTDFVVDLFDVPVIPLDSVNSLPYYKHLLVSNKIPFWSYPQVGLAKLIELIKNEDSNVLGKKLDPFRLTKKETKMIEWIASNITAVVDKKTSVITLSVTDVDPQVSALMADTVMQRLQDYITLYRTQKARHDLKYIKELYEQARQEYMEAQNKYVQASDANRNVFLESLNSHIKNLENEMQLRLTVYTETAQQLQLAKAKVQEQTPAFTVLQSATIPVRPSSMPKMVVVFIFVVLGGMLDAAWVLFLRDIYNKKRKTKEIA